MKYFEFGKENEELMVLLHGGGTSYLGVLPSTRPNRRRNFSLWPVRHKVWKTIS